MTKQLDFFHNTTGLLPSEKWEREKKAMKQTDLVLEFFKQRPHNDYTPAQVWEQEQFKVYPLTSIRRAMSDLTKAGELVKTDNKRTGAYGEVNYTWKLNLNKK